MVIYITIYMNCEICNEILEFDYIKRNDGVTICKECAHDLLLGSHD